MGWYLMHLRWLSGMCASLSLFHSKSKMRAALFGWDEKRLGESGNEVGEPYATLVHAADAPSSAGWARTEFLWEYHVLPKR